MLNTVMLVDDSDLDLLFTSVIIERAGVASRGLRCHSAREALGLLQGPEADAVDAILLDLQMPGMDGLDFLDAYDGLWAGGRCHAGVIMLTGSPDPWDRARALAHRCVLDYLMKPLDIKSALHLAARMSLAARLNDVHAA